MILFLLNVLVRLSIETLDIIWNLSMLVSMSNIFLMMESCKRGTITFCFKISFIYIFTHIVFTKDKKINLL